MAAKRVAYNDVIDVDRNQAESRNRKVGKERGRKGGTSNKECPQDKFLATAVATGHDDVAYTPRDII